MKQNMLGPKGENLLELFQNRFYSPLKYSAPESKCSVIKCSLNVLVGFQLQIILLLSGKVLEEFRP